MALCAATSCSFDRAERWLTENEAAGPGPCQLGERRCIERLERCARVSGGAAWVTERDCAAEGKVCAPALLACTACVPGAGRCEGQTVLRCDAAGAGFSAETTCDVEAGLACRNGACSHLCGAAIEQKSNVGCEYWAVDLDNARIDDALNAAAQQFAVVVSNPQPDLPARVLVEQDDTLPGQDNQPISIASATVPPLGLRVFKLGPREVDGSPRGSFDSGTHSAHTRSAFRVTSSVPVVAYQFNPLENVNVFSNDASLLKPVEAIPHSSELKPAYVVVGWPQTIASTDDPDTNFSAREPVDLRAFLTLVGTRSETRVRIRPAARIIGGGGVPATDAGGVLELELGPFDVLNLESDDFNADFSGSIVYSDQPVVAFSGSEASDAPFFDKLVSRLCCADHLEEQLDPIRTAGKQFVASVSANRTRALADAGANIGVVEQPEFFRVIAATAAGARVTTTLPGKDASVVLAALGSFADFTSEHHFMLVSDAPVMLASVSASQFAAFVTQRGLPGGDPSLLVIPPVEQYRANYVFLTPDKYNFDFLRIVAPPGANIVLDGQRLADVPGCSTSPADGLTAALRGSERAPFLVHRCQLGFPVIDPTLEGPQNVTPGRQNDGVHRVDADMKVSVLVDGFDSFVSYAYAAGTELTEIVPE
jgi:hypothetical protein